MHSKELEKAAFSTSTLLLVQLKKSSRCQKDYLTYIVGTLCPRLNNSVVRPPAGLSGENGL